MLGEAGPGGNRKHVGRRPVRLAVLALAAMLLLGTGAVALALTQTSTPDFFKRYHLLDRRYVNLAHSAHEGIGCRICHETDPVANGVDLTRDFYRSLIREDQYPAYYTFRSPTNAACLSCHSNDWTHAAGAIPHPAHGRVVDETRPCTGCHKWTAHLEDYRDKHKKMPFSGVCAQYGCHVGAKQPDDCRACHHVLESAPEGWRTSHPDVVRAAGQNGCLENCHGIDECQQCHTTGKAPAFEARPVRVSHDIERRHVNATWTEEHGGYARKSLKECLVCHQSQGECAECHRERPKSHGSTLKWIGRHKDHAKSVEDPGCITCHQKKWCDECHGQFKEME